MPRYNLPATGTVTVPSAPTTNGVAASLSPMRPTSAPRPALGTISGRNVSTQPRWAPAGVMPVSLPMVTVPLAVMCSLSPALTSIFVSTHFVLPATVTSALVLLAVAAARTGATTGEDARLAYQKELLISAAIRIQRADFIGLGKRLTKV